MKLVAVLLTSQTREAVIGDCLKTLIDWVDELIIVELDGAVIHNPTYTNDTTFDIAHEICGDKLVIRHWTEFGDPRLFEDGGPHFRDRAIQAATEAEADWCIHLDTDERIVGYAHDIKKILEQMPPDIEVVQLWHQGRTYVKPMFFKLPIRGKWNHLVHETFDPVGGTARIEGLVFKELGKTPEQIKARSEFDIYYLKKELEKAPENFRWNFYLSSALDAVGKQDEAIELLKKCEHYAELTNTQKACMCYTAGHYLFMQEKPMESLERCVRAMYHSPMMAEAAWLAAVICYGYQRWDDAKIWLSVVDMTKNAELDIMFRSTQTMLKCVEGLKDAIERRDPGYSPDFDKLKQENDLVGVAEGPAKPA